MQRFPRCWDKITCINYLQRKIILNCIAYYELNNNQLTDKAYDELSKQLVQLQEDVNVEDTQYGYIMYDFDGSTGFDLYNRLNEHDRKYLMNIAVSVLGIKKQQEKPKKKKGSLF